ncbi:MAG: hypothetical protein U0840_21425 [Gemmataceae bacterium]
MLRSFLVLPVLGLVPAMSLAQKPTWHDDYTRARAEAQRTNKLLFVVFRCQP